jgi:L,D-peptidoglycan transpeptidase YkuD (ErfK/YbiS/YcfS/YnhG family)
MRRLLYRADRAPAPATGLPSFPIEPDDAWCEDPADRHYNRPIKLEPGEDGDRLWREDHLYDLIVVLGHNDDPVRAGKGSAIFLHLARNTYSPTQGCIAVSRPDMERILSEATPGSRLIVRA